MAIEVQRYPQKGDPIIPVEDEEVIVELQDEDPTAGGS